MIETKFKNSEVGFIPEEWEVKPLGKVAFLKSGEAINFVTEKEGIIPCYGGNGIRAYISRFSHEGTFPIVGRQGALCGNVQLAQGKFYATEHAVVCHPNNGIDAVWLYYQLIAANLNQYNTGNAQPGLSVDRINKVAFLPVPYKKNEQSRIATALSDIDDLIATTKKLIEKKRNIKEGAMQELLSGKRRLPGFKEEWKEANVGSVTGKISRGQTLTSDEFCFGIIPVMAGGKQYAGYHNKANQKGRCITISGSGASAGFVYLHKTPIFATDCSVIAESNSFSLNFMYYLLSFKQDDLYKLQTGGAQPHVYPRDIEAIEIIVPSTKREQQAIAQVLSDMDSEIQSLESQLTKYQSLKQGMMQQLLTGKIRLI